MAGGFGKPIHRVPPWQVIGEVASQFAPTTVP
jgi:hypothetical protein